MTYLDGVKKQCEEAFDAHLQRLEPDRKKRALLRWFLHVRNRCVVFHLTHGRLPTTDEMVAELNADL